MPMIPIESEILQDLLARRDELVRAITAGMTSGEWDQVMAPFDQLLAAIKRLEEGLGVGEPRPS
jgi:hypothetical protein